MTETDDDSIEIDFRYVQIEYELWALGHMLGVIEPAISHLSQQDKADTIAELKRNGWDHDEAEVDLAFQGVTEKRDHVLPRFMRGPFLVSLWACFESSVQAVARTKGREVGAPIAFSELRGSTFLKQARRYFEALLSMALDDDEGRYQRLGDLYAVRNALAHANGLREGMSDEKWRELTGTLARYGVKLDNSRGVVVLTQAYVQGAYDDVSTSLRSLVTRARAPQDETPMSR